MVLPISGFLPVPLPMMIPFMGAQSLVIGKMFGEGFQYGKRKISAMPNEEFNKLTFEDMMSNAREELKASIPTMQQALMDMTPMVDTVIREFLKYINEVSKTLQEVTGTGIDEAAHLLGGHVGHGPPTPIPQPIPPGPSPQQPFQPFNPTPFTPTTPKVPSKPKATENAKLSLAKTEKNVITIGKILQSLFKSIKTVMPKSNLFNALNNQIDIQKKALKNQQDHIMFLHGKWDFS